MKTLKFLNKYKNKFVPKMSLSFPNVINVNNKGIQCNFVHEYIKNLTSNLLFYEIYFPYPKYEIKMK